MRLTLLLTVLALFCACAFAWEKEDYEIFDLVGAVEKAEGKGTTFYSWLDVPPTATTPQIAKAFRRKSIEMHPDKNIGVKGIHERFARLTVVGDILKNGERRKRYDFFYKNGVPKWRGTGYYYDRFRPGLGTVLTFLVLITSCMHYLVMEIQYRQDLTRITRFVNDAKAAAWGPKLTPIEGKRKVKVPVGPSRVDEDGNVFASRGVEMVVEGSGDVYIVESNGDLTPLNATAATPPSFKRTWFFTLVTSLANKAKAKATGAGAGVDGDNGEEGDDSEYTDSTPGTPNSENSASTGALPRAAATKAGGKRRKVPKRK